VTARDGWPSAIYGGKEGGKSRRLEEDKRGDLKGKGQVDKQNEGNLWW
jgi:hypothetical protein